MPLKPDGYTIFCDDIRQEIGNKCSLMGIYGPDMFVDNPFPLMMAKMGFHITFRDDPHAQLSPITLCIYLPVYEQDNPTYRSDIYRSQAALPPLPGTLGPTARRMATINVLLSPLNLKEPGKIKVRMLVDGEKIKLGTLRVAYKDPAAPAATEVSSAPG